MTYRTLILRSLRFYWRTHLSVVLGAALSATILVGALVVGDSVRASLRAMALARLGNVALAMAPPDRFFRAALADDLASELKAPTAPALQLRGLAANSDGTARANRVQVLGVDSRFWALGPARDLLSGAGEDAVVLNDRLAAQLGVRVGDDVVIRVEEPSVLPRDAPLSSDQDASVALRLTVAAIATDADFGRFSLQANQIPPYNAFLPLARLQKEAKQDGRANLLLAAGGSGMALTPARAEAALRNCWSLGDADLEVRELPELGYVELRSRRIFLDPAVEQAAIRKTPNEVRILTYFVNEFRVGERMALYAMAAAVFCPGRYCPGQGPRTHCDDLLTQLSNFSRYVAIINKALADDLRAKVGDTLSITYFVLGPKRTLETEKREFYIEDVLPMDGLANDPTLMPPYPGISEAKSCYDWKPGIPIDLSKIRKKDEEYWEKHRGTPKAFVSLREGQRMWANRYGNLTAIRYPSNEFNVQGLSDSVRKALDPASLGLVFQPVREQAMAASGQAMDFGQLFLGFSFFLIVAALLLMGLLFAFGIEQRTEEVGTLLALGFPPKTVRRLLLGEGAALAILGSAIGAACGTLYTRLVLRGLSTVWQGAVAGASLRFHAEPMTIAIGAGASVLVAILAMWLVLLRQARRPARELLAGPEEVAASAINGHGQGGEPVPSVMLSEAKHLSEGRADATGAHPVRGVSPSERSFASLRMTGGERTTRAGIWRWLRGRLSQWIAVAALVGGLVLVSLAVAQRDRGAAGAFFGAGGLLLVSGLAACHALLTRLARPFPLQSSSSSIFSSSSRRLTLSTLGIRNAARRRGRSLAVIGLLACGSFLVVAVGANRHDPTAEAHLRSSATGGFALYGESALPVYRDLNSPDGRKAFGLDAKALEGVSIVQLRLHEGDDASCLNLNRAQSPRLLGVRPEDLESRRAFGFERLSAGVPSNAGWSVLRSDVGRTSGAATPDRPGGAESKDRLGEAGYGQTQDRRGVAGHAEPIPAVADENTVTWGLSKSLGGLVPYADEAGREVSLRIAGIIGNSILQGSLLISEDRFTTLFPSESGYRVFLIDAPPDRVEAVRDGLTLALQDFGLELTPAARRLAEFNAVENTYLSIFQALGGLGLLLGSVGLGIVVLRNVLERRGELALLRAIGFPKRSIRWLVLAEHWGLVGLGLACGVAAAVVAVLPALRSPAAGVPYVSLGLTLMAVILSGLVWTWLAAAAALRGPLLPALRNE